MKKFHTRKYLKILNFIKDIKTKNVIAKKKGINMVKCFFHLPRLFPRIKEKGLQAGLHFLIIRKITIL